MQFSGVLFFPVTPFDADGALAADVLARHLEQGLRHEPGGVFVACGTGEFHALSVEEVAAAARVAVRAVAGQVPVIAGVGGSLPHALAGARQAATAGVDGVLLLPPYLQSGPPDGLAAYVAAVADASWVPVIAYQRPGAVFTPETAARVASHPQVVGFKDGLGDLDRMQRIVLATREAAGEGFLFFNGLPTAELTMPAYRGLGVDLYSSAAFCFLPEVATAFQRALASGDQALAAALLADFYRPLVELRDRAPGYAVALPKAGVRLRGLDVGGVRPPLTDPPEPDLDELHRVIKAGLAHVTGA